MLSRVAESMFWMSRYMERAENTARFLDTHFQLLLDLNRITAVDSALSYWEPIVLATCDWDQFRQVSSGRKELFDAHAVIEYLVFNRHNPNSISSCIGMARENARSILESISSEMWEQVNHLFHVVQRASSTLGRIEAQSTHMGIDPYSLLKEVKTGSHLFQGITDCTLSRSEGWEFVQAGKHLERADNAARLLDVKYKSLRLDEGIHYGSVDVIQWMAVLKSLCGLEAFRRVYLSRIEPDTILNFLVLDRDFPRSIYFCVVAAAEALARISGGSRPSHANGADQIIGKLVAELSYTTLADLFERGLQAYFSELKSRIARVGEQVHQVYFAYHAPQIASKTLEPPLPFMGLTGRRAAWSQAEQQQQQ